MPTIRKAVAVAAWLICAAAGESVQAKPTPVRDAFAASLAISAWECSRGGTNSFGAWSGVNHTDEFELKAAGGKSVLKAGLLSALVPGSGQYYLGHKKKARYFFAAEALTWVGFISFRTYGHWKEDDYIRYAAIHANARLEGKDDHFRDLVGFYHDIDQYNNVGRIFNPDRPYLEDTPDNHWRWESEEDRNTYRELKNRSREAYRRADFMIGAAIVVRVISVIDAVRDAKRVERSLDESLSRSRSKRLRLAVDPFSANSQIRLTLLTDF